MTTEQKELAIIQALTVCAELTGTQLSEAAFDVMVDDLMAYEAQSVLAALNRCRRELTGRLTLAAILQRLDTGLPSADEAFGMLVEGWRNEALTVVVPAIAMQAAGNGAQELYFGGDKTGARMAFREAYERLAAADVQGTTAWFVSAGNDRDQRSAAVMAAVKAGRLEQQQAAAYLPHEAVEERLLLAENRVLLPAEKAAAQQHTGKLLALLADRMVMGKDVRP